MLNRTGDQLIPQISLNNGLNSYTGKMTGTGRFHGVGVVQFHDFEV